MFAPTLLYVMLTAGQPETLQQGPRVPQPKGSFLMDGLWYFAREPERRCSSFEPIRHKQPLAEQLRLSLSTNKRSFYVAEPIRLTMGLRNEGNSAVRGSLALDLSCGFAQVYYRRVPGPFGELLRLDPHRIPQPDGTVKGGIGQPQGSPRILRPDEEFVQQPTLAIDPLAGGFVLDQPGEYELKVEYRDVVSDPNGMLRSDTLTVRAEAPTGREEEALAAYTRGGLAPLAQYDQTDSPEIPPAIRKAARDFLERYPESAYADHVKRGLFNMLLRLTNDNRATAAERESFEKLRVEGIGHK